MIYFFKTKNYSTEISFVRLYEISRQKYILKLHYTITLQEVDVTVRIDSKF